MYLRSELGDGTIGVMKTLKTALDPRGIMNPGKVGSIVDEMLTFSCILTIRMADLHASQGSLPMLLPFALEPLCMMTISTIP